MPPLLFVASINLDPKKQALNAGLIRNFKFAMLIRPFSEQLCKGDVIPIRNDRK